MKMELTDQDWRTIEQALFTARREAAQALGRLAKGGGRTGATVNAQMRWIQQRDRANEVLEKIHTQHHWWATTSHEGFTPNTLGGRPLDIG